MKTCPRCEREHRDTGRVCAPCRRKRFCNYCSDRYAQAGRISCTVCEKALQAIPMVAACRPPDGWPEGHLERLAERAAAGLPLFGR